MPKMKRALMFLVAGVFVIYANATGVGNGVHVNFDDSLFDGEIEEDNSTYTGKVKARCETYDAIDKTKGSGLMYCSRNATVYVTITPSNDDGTRELQKTLTDQNAGHCSSSTAIIFDVKYDPESRTFSTDARSDCAPVVN